MKKLVRKSVYDASVAYAFYKTLSSPRIRPTAIKCIASIFYNFFFRQFKAVFLPGRAPVSKVDHPLDEKIPFTPSWVRIYLDFTAFWVRVVSFLLRNYGGKARTEVIRFIRSIDELYAFAAGIYQKNFSTTKRPFYIARPRFFIIHLVDPHLMCIPSLHVMIAIWTWIKFTRIMRNLGEEKKLAPQIEEMRQGALAISRAILYVKQHSINCIPATLYAMTCFDPALWTAADAEAFTIELLGGKRRTTETFLKKPVNYGVRPAAAPGDAIKADDALKIQNHIISLFRRFLSEKKDTEYWGAPLLKFLKEIREKPAPTGQAHEPNSHTARDNVTQKR